MKCVFAFICVYGKIPLISPKFVLIQTHFLGGLYLGELLTGGAYDWRYFFVRRIMLFSFFFRNRIQNAAAFFCLHVYSFSVSSLCCSSSLEPVSVAASSSSSSLIYKHTNVMFSPKGLIFGRAYIQGAFNRRDLYVSNLVRLCPGEPITE